MKRKVYKMILSFSYSSHLKKKGGGGRGDGTLCVNRKKGVCRPDILLNKRLRGIAPSAEKIRKVKRGYCVSTPA